MKKVISILVTLAMSASLMVGALAAEEQTLVMTIDSPTMTVDGVEAEVDPGLGTTPVILNDRTVLPVRAAVEALGGEVAWDADTRTATLTYDDNKIDLVIDSVTAYLNDEEQTLDVAPVIINDRTFLPIRFIAEGFGWTVDWNDAAKEVTIVKPAAKEDSDELNVVVDPAIANEVKVESDGPYVSKSNFDKTYFVEDKALNNGYTMPVLGIGTYALTVEQAENSVYHALKDGYRLVDTARAYNNEVGVGKGIQRAIDEGYVTREEIFVTTKVWDTDFGNARAAFDASLERLGLDYVDLVLLHHVPRDNDEAAYHELEEAVKEGKIRSLGLSNIYRDNDTFDRMYEAAEIKPVLVQNENHPFFQNIDFKDYIGQYGLFVESWYPLGGRGFTQNYFNHETLLKIAEAHDKTVPQIQLRWHIQAGYITIPGSSNPDHIAENYDIFDFELSDEEMQTINDLNTGHGNFYLRAQ